MGIESLQDLRQLILAGEDNWSQYGGVSVKEKGDLLLFNYKPEAQFNARWNWFERSSRGLIMDKAGNMVARPFDKFFNWGEGGRYPPQGSHKTWITEKKDRKELA